MFQRQRYRLYPTAAQAELLDKHINCCRFVYNIALQTKKEAYIAYGKSLSRFDLQAQLVGLKDECPWLKEVFSHSLQSEMLHLDSAYSAFFKGNAKFPNFKKKSHKNSFHIPDAFSIDLESNKIQLPKFKTPIKTVISRKFTGTAKSITIIKTPTGKYFASVLIEDGLTAPAKKPTANETAVGLDLGIKTFAVLSDGETFDNPKFLAKSLKKLKHEQRNLSRKKKGGNRRKAQALKVAKIHEKIANQRADFLHKTSDAITKRYDTICTESLQVSNMILNHKLARHIGDAGWGEFMWQLEYKSERRGKNLIKIGTFEPSSKTCSICGWTHSKLTLAERTWTCGGCGTELDRDVNAAVNIKTFGLRKWRAGSSSIGVELPTMVGTKKRRCKSLISG